MTITNSIPTAQANQKHLRNLSTGRLIAVIADTTTNAKFLWSDNGQTWTDFVADIAGWANGSIDVYVDSGGTERIVAVWKQSGTGGGRTDLQTYVMVGSFNAGRTTITWGAAVVAYTNTFGNYPDIVANPEGTDGAAHIVLAHTQSPNNYAVYLPVSITGNVASMGSTFTLGGTYSVVVATFPSIDIDRTTKRLFAAWSAGATGSGKGIRFRTASYSSGIWTWASEVEIDTTVYVSSVALWIIARWDGTRIVLGLFGTTNGTTRCIFVYESTNFTSFTTRTIKTTASIVAGDYLAWGNITIDTITGDIYFFGDANTNNTFGYRKWTRSTLTLEDVIILETYSNSAYPSAHYSGSKIRWIYGFGNNSPYQVRYDEISLNVAPNTPSNLQRTSAVSDTTPVFSADISDNDTGQQIKCRFEIYQNDEVTLVGTVDSALTTGSHTATAEYSSSLSNGLYKLRAKTIDDGGLESGYTAWVAFTIGVTVNDDLELLWNAQVTVTDDLDARWNVVVNNQVDFEVLWNVQAQVVPIDLSLKWSSRTTWVPVDDTLVASTWSEV